jgi:hypothetical protein
MINSFKKYIANILIILLNFSASSMENKENFEKKYLRKIGIEIETNSIKIKDIQRNNIGFLFRSGDKGWKLEDDTRDNLEKENAHLYNLEINTIDGYHFDDFMDILNLMTTFIKKIYFNHQQQKNEFSKLTLERAREIINNFDPTYTTEKLAEYQKDLEITINSNHNRVRPQVTYQVHLEEIPRVFNRLAILGHENINQFVISLRNEFNDFVIKKEYENKEKFKKLSLLNYFNKSFSDKLNNGNLSKKVIGLSYLFLFYWENLFHNGTRNISQEPGPKSALGIMSRIPFSEMYDYCLNKDEQEQFKKLFDDVINKIGDKFILIDYLTEEDTLKYDNISLLQWYNSIIDKNQNNSSSNSKKNLTRKDKKTQMARKTSRGINGRRDVDLLSPPPQLNGLYSMGSYAVDKSNPAAILEVRGYPKVFVDANIENVYSLLKKEANWFFEIEEE